MPATALRPSAEARALFNEMYQRSDDGHLSLDKTLELSLDRKHKGLSDGDEIFQLEQEGWIAPDEDGGWLLS